MLLLRTITISETDLKSYNWHLTEFVCEFESVKLLIRGDMLIVNVLILKEKKKISKFVFSFHSLMSPPPLIALEQFRQENNEKVPVPDSKNT